MFMTHINSSFWLETIDHNPTCLKIGLRLNVIQIANGPHILQGLKSFYDRDSVLKEVKRRWLYI